MARMWICSLALLTVLVKGASASTYISSFPSLTSLNENNDDEQTLWYISGKVDVDYTCLTQTCYRSLFQSDDCNNCQGYDSIFDWFSYRCYGSCTREEDCDSYSIANYGRGVIALSENRVYRPACQNRGCRSCSIDNYCGTGGQSYDYIVYCKTSGSTTASQSSSLSFYSDSHPPFSFNGNLGNSIQVGKSIAIGSVVNQAYSNPISQTSDNDVIHRYYRNGGDDPSWLTIESGTGNIKVSSSLASETASSKSIEYCAEDRRGRTNCGTLIITIYSSAITNSPYDTRLHENTDFRRRIWNIEATCDITYTCHGSFTCSGTYSCDSCSVANNVGLFGVGVDMNVYKKKCLQEFCHPCDIRQYCVDAGESYTYTITCQKTNTFGHSGHTTGTPSKTATLSFFADIQPPFAYKFGTNVIVFQNNSVPGTIINTILSNPIESEDDNDQIFYYHKSGPRPSWIHWNTLFALDTSTGHVKVTKDLSKEFSYTFNMELCVRNRRNYTNCGAFDITLWACYQTPNCSNQQILNLKDTHGIEYHNPNKSLFQMIYPQPTDHFPNFRSTWSKLTWYLANGGFVESTINEDTGEIYLTRNISIWPSWPTRHYTETVTVKNSESCYTTTCQMDVTIFYTNWPPHIRSLPASKELHEDTDAETRLHYLQVYDYNYDRLSDNHAEEDNATCWIQYVYDQWGENDMELFSLRQENPNYRNNWDSYTLWKNECVVPGSPYSPPCGFKRENYTCPKHSGCMTHNVTQWYNVSIICRDGYGAQDNRNFTFYPIHNEAPRWRNLGNHRDIDLKTGSEHDIIFSIMYTDKENENLTYEYTFTRVDNNEPTTLFKGDPSGNYFNTLGNISLTTYLFDVDKNTSYSIFICGHERRNEICEYLTVDIEEYCEIVPTCSSAENTVDETVAIGTNIFNVASLISVSNARIKFTMNANRNDLFEIDDLGKVRTIATLPASYPSTTYFLNAFVELDGAAYCSSYSICPLKLHVNYINNALQITNLPASVNIREDETMTLTLWTIETSDVDVDDEAKCEITNPDNNKPFYLTETFAGSNVYVIKNHVAGTDTTRKLSSAKILYTINVNCTDQLGEGQTGHVTINVLLNQAPSLTTIIGTLEMHVDQSTRFKDFTIVTEIANDPEGDDLIYTCSEVSSNNPLTCAINDNHLKVNMRRNVSVENENEKVFSMEVCVRDALHIGRACGILRVTFTTNHSYPSISNLPNTLELNENERVGDVVFTSVVADVDSGETHSFSIRFSPSSGSKYFSLNPSTGEVTLTSPLDYEGVQRFLLIFTVKDPYLTSLDTNTLVVNVLNVNEQNTLTSSISAITFKETAKVGRSWRTGLSCTDIDHVDTQTITIESGEHMDYFSYKQSDNKLYLEKVWDLDDIALALPKTTLITMKCEDSGGMVSMYNLAINVEPVNNQKPEIVKEECIQETTGSGSPRISLDRQSDLSTKFCAIRCQVADLDDEATCTFSILGNGLGRKYFETRTTRSSGRRRRAESVSAGLYLRQAIDLNYNKDFVFNVKVSDGGSPPQFSTIAFAVNYTALVNPPKAVEKGSSLTASKSGNTLIGFLAIELAIITLFAIHAVVQMCCSGKNEIAHKGDVSKNQRFKLPHKSQTSSFTSSGDKANSIASKQRKSSIATRVSQRQKPSTMLSYSLNSSSESSSSDDESDEDPRYRRDRSRIDIGRNAYSHFPSSISNISGSTSGLPQPIFSSQVPHADESDLPGAI